MSDTPNIDIRPDHWRIVRDILRKHVPHHEVWAFGSRAKWLAKQYSDLDLAIITDQPLSLAVSAALADDFSESDLPWKVDVVDWATTGESFRKIIERDKVVVQKLWKEISLAGVYEFSSGLSKPRSEFGSGFPFLSFKDVFYNSAVPTELSELVNSTAQERNRCSVKRGDVFLTRTSETLNELGMSSVALTDIPCATFNGFTKRLRPKQEQVIAPEFARYFFRSGKFRSAVRAMSSMSTRASLNNEMLERLTISFPSFEEQTEIGGILCALDDKIRINRRMNQTLEAMASALFKSWFVDFDGVPQEEMQESELGLIPKGWRAASLDSIAHYLNGLALQKFPPESEVEFLPVIKIAQLRAGHAQNADKASTRLKSEYIVQDGDVLFSWSGTLEVDVWTGGRGALNQHLFKVTSTEVPKWFYYFATRQHLPNFRTIAAGKATTMGHIQRKHLADAKVAVPPTDAMSEFDHTIAPLFEQIINNALQSRTLAQQRDILLPKLISGEFRVRDVKCFLEKAK
ncbi:restriction endonuclease subunit S [Xanthomonas sp. D-99]|uniref:restriction endonuclease subunit S n=1 Tax=Xanthomonas sp. D-99 TaxID=2821273 RepID=UPI001AD9B0B3|nr:restriction endonuclease subunit S [Xanthomonas sp. D-99]MBO9879469.1 restriction endonuclease subunit S [Xanthomonas sp. D-99]